MDAASKALFSGHAFTAAQTFVAGVSRQTKKRELTSDIGRKYFGRFNGQCVRSFFSKSEKAE